MIDMERIEQLRHLCRVDLIQQAGYQIEAEEFLFSFLLNRYTLTAKNGGIQFDLGRLLLSSELGEGVEELYDTMVQQGVLRKDSDRYEKSVKELWEELSKVGHPLLSQAEVDSRLQWRLELEGVEYLGMTILEVLDKAMTCLGLPSKTSPTVDKNEPVPVAEKNGKMSLKLNGFLIPNVESCWLTPQENGGLEVSITYTIEPKDKILWELTIS